MKRINKDAWTLISYIARGGHDCLPTRGWAAKLVERRKDNRAKENAKSLEVLETFLFENSHALRECDCHPAKDAQS